MIFVLEKITLFILCKLVIVLCRIHKLSLTDDERSYVDLTAFGFFQGGVLDIKIANFMLPNGPIYGQYGFTLDRTINDAISPYLETSDVCLLNDSGTGVISPQHPAIVLLKMDFKQMRLRITCKGEITGLQLFSNISSLLQKHRIKRVPYSLMNNKPVKASDVACPNAELPITKEVHNGFVSYNTSFAIYVASKSDEGLYNLYFYNCPETKSGVSMPMNMVIEIYERNIGSYLSAGEMPLPDLYTTMSLVFFFSAVLWTFILKTSKHPVYKIHIIMCILVYLKALSLAFHGINYHFIKTKGEHVTAWAILYYITHLLKGAVLFVTIVLVGTGWNFIKHILADKDKKLFMIVIPLQVVANVAEIIIAESEKGAAEHNIWRTIFISVDLLCCGAILFPVVWSIRHLQDASSTDGKAAINLRKLKLFRHFYIMVVCYIYFTRIIVFLLKITVSFQFSWIDEMFRELATFIFFVMTGYKFRPAAANPYFTPNHVEDDESEVLSQVGVLEGVTKISNRNERKQEDLQPLIQETNYNSD